MFLFSDLVYYPCDYSPKLDLTPIPQFNPPIIRAVTDQYPLPALGDEPLHKKFSINHGDHDVVGQRIDGLVHDQDVTGMYPCIDHGSPFNPHKERGGRVLDEKLVEVYGLVYGAVCRRWWTCGDWGGEERGLQKRLPVVIP